MKRVYLARETTCLLNETYVETETSLNVEKQMVKPG